VAALNKLARDMDENAEAMHESAWKEQLAPEREAYTNLAKRGPTARRCSARRKA